jgi:hypothetical protein
MDTMDYLCRRCFFVVDSVGKASLHLTGLFLHEEYVDIMEARTDSLSKLKPLQKSDFTDTTEYKYQRSILSADKTSSQFIYGCAVDYSNCFTQHGPFNDKDIPILKNPDGSAVQALDGRTGLIFGCQHNYDKKLIKNFLDMGADKSAKDRYGKTALDYCYANNNKKLIALLEGRSGMPPKVSKGLTWLVVGGLFGGTAAFLRSTVDGHYKKAQDYYDLFREQPRTDTWTSYETEYKAYSDMMRASDICYYCAGGCATISILYFIFGPSESPGHAAIYSDDHIAISLAPTGNGVSLGVDLKGGRP